MRTRFFGIALSSAGIVLMLSPATWVRADTAAKVAEVHQQAQENAQLADSLNAKGNALGKQYQAALDEETANHYSAESRAKTRKIEASMNSLQVESAKESGALDRRQSARIIERHAAEKSKSKTLISSVQGGGKKSGGGSLSSAPSAPEVQLDGSAIPKEMQFSGGKAAPSAKKSLREQVLEDARKKLGIKPSGN